MTRPTGKANGRPKFQPTEAQRMLVTVLRANGVDPRQIAREVTMSEVSLYKHFRDEMDNGFARIEAQLGAKVVSKALKGDNACIFFWLKTQAGWKETHTLEHGGLNGSPLDAPVLVINFVDPPALTNVTDLEPIED